MRVGFDIVLFGTKLYTNEWYLLLTFASFFLRLIAGDKLDSFCRLSQRCLCPEISLQIGNIEPKRQTANRFFSQPYWHNQSMPSNRVFLWGSSKPGLTADICQPDESASVHDWGEPSIAMREVDLLHVAHYLHFVVRHFHRLG